MRLKKVLIQAVGEIQGLSEIRSTVTIQISALLSVVRI